MGVDASNFTGMTLGNNYELRDMLGRGGMGFVFRAYEKSLKRPVAVKLLLPQLIYDNTFLARFSREAETSANLEHSNIVPVYHYGIENNMSYVVMRLLEGGTLSQWVQKGSANQETLRSIDEISQLLRQLASALDYAHSRGVVHRDIKPSNVMFDNHGTAYLVDFGIAKLVQDNFDATQLTATGHTMGTPAYMPPEQWEGGDLVPATDQYALACMVYELLTGKPPFEARTPMALMRMHFQETPPPVHTARGELPETMDQVLNKALAKNPDDRFPTVTAFYKAFSSAIDSAYKNSPVIPVPTPVQSVVDSQPQESASQPSSEIAPEPELATEEQTASSQESQTISETPAQVEIPTEEPVDQPSLDASPPESPTEAQPAPSDEQQTISETPAQVEIAPEEIGLTNPLPFTIAAVEQDSDFREPQQTLTGLPEEESSLVAVAVKEDTPATSTAGTQSVAESKIESFDLSGSQLLEDPSGTQTKTKKRRIKWLAVPILGIVLAIIGFYLTQRQPQCGNIAINSDDDVSDAAEEMYRNSVIHACNDEFELAIEEVSRAIEVSPNWSVPYSARASWYVDVANYQAALQDYTRAIQLLPEGSTFSESTLLVDRGLVYENLQQYNEAINDYDEAIRIHPLFMNPYRARGRAYSIVGNYTLAISDFDHVIQSFPDGSLYADRGLAYYRLGNNAQALEDWNQAESLGYQLSTEVQSIKADLEQEMGSGIPEATVQQSIVPTSTPSPMQGSSLWVQFYEDTNENAIRDDDELMVTQGAVVQIVNQDGVVIARRSLDDSPNASQGLIGFMDIALGDYMVLITSDEYQPTGEFEFPITIRAEGLPILLQYSAKPLLP